MQEESNEIGAIERLVDAESFEMWNFQMTVYFKASGLYAIVTDCEKFEVLTEEKDKKSWIQRDAKAQKIIISTVDKKVLVHMFNCQTSAEMYQKLKTIFKKDNEDQKCRLLQEFFSSQFEKGSDIATHVSKLQNLAYRLKSLKQDVSDEMMCSKILSTLPGEYKFFKTAWESTTNAEKTLTNLVSRLLSEETMNKNEEKGRTPVAFQCSSLDKTCYICKKVGHIARFCRNKNKNYACTDKYQNANQTGYNSRMVNTTQEVKCRICKKVNHTENNCFFRDKHKNYNKTEQSNNKISFLTESSSSREFSRNVFVLDSGSTAHMVNDHKIFKNLTKTNSEICVAKKGTKITAKGIGEIEMKECTLKDVLYVPDLSKNLLSVKAITENHGQVIFENDKVHIMKENEKILEGTKNEKGLYIIELTKEDHWDETFLVSTKEEKIKNWHSKLGHINIKDIKKLIDKQMVTGMDIKTTDCDYFETPCEICIKGKQVRAPFNTERTRAGRPLEIIHSDLCGPIDPPTWDNKKYILTLMDDYTHYVVIYLLEYKSETVDFIKEYVEEVERDKTMKIKKIRSDNGGEYRNNKLENYCKEKGIIMDPIIPYSPQLNGKAERLNRTLIEKVRTLLFDMNVNKKFWGEAARVAAFILNRSPTESLSLDLTPIEMWTGNKPDLKRLQIFGSEVYAKTLGYLNKLDSRSEKFLFMGYAPTGYRLWDERKQRIMIRRDVVFKKKGDNMKKNMVRKFNEHELTENEECDWSIQHNNEQEPDMEIQQDIESECIQQQDNCKEQQNETSIHENEIEYIYEEVSDNGDEEDLNSGQGNSTERQDTRTRSGRRINKPKHYDDFALLTYNEAMQSEERDRWKKAIEDEKGSLEKNQTWEYIDKKEANGTKVLTNKWVFKIKDDGTYKARLVVRGCQQQKGIDYTEVFSPVVNISSLRMLLAISVKRNFILKKFDIKTAFLYGKITEDIYMNVPEGYEEQEGKICKLKKSLYGLKQAPMKWNECFTKCLKEYDMKPLSIDQCIFTNQIGTLMLAIYVDDGLVAGERNEDIDSLLRKLEENFEIKKFEEVDMFLGIRLTKGDNWMKLDQKKYTESILEKFHMENAKSAATPITDNNDNCQIELKPEKFPYREAVGSLLYLSNKTRPDIAYAVGFCSRNLENPTRADINNVKRIFRYLAGTRDDGIIYKKDEKDEMLKAYSDSDFAGDKMTRKSTTGYVVFYCNGPISWSSRKQPVVALSSTEAEFIAAAESVKEVLYVKTLFESIILRNISATLNIDNQSAISIIKNAQFNRRSKHIDVRFHFIHEKVNEGLINVKYLCTEENIADIFTKALNSVKFMKHKNELVI